MKLKNAVFYQSIQLWDGSQTQTVKIEDGIEIDLDEHLVKLSRKDKDIVLIIPTANLRHATATYLQAFTVKKPELNQSQGNVLETKPKVNVKK